MQGRAIGGGRLPHSIPRDSKTHYPIAIHQQEGYPWGKPANLDVSLPLSEKSAASVISLPMFPELTQEEMDYVIRTVRAWEG